MNLRVGLPLGLVLALLFTLSLLTPWGALDRLFA